MYLPLTTSVGRCTVAVLLPEGLGYSSSIVVDTLEMNVAAENLRQKCVQEAAMGGRFHQSNSLRNDEITELPEIAMFAPDSKWKEFLDLKFRCVVKAKGNAECKPLPKTTPRTKSGAYGTWKYMGTIGSQGWSNSGKDKQSCSGACYNPSDCDINSDCLCASNKGNAWRILLFFFFIFQKCTSEKELTWK